MIDFIFLGEREAQQQNDNGKCEVFFCCKTIGICLSLETIYNNDDSPRKKIDDLIHLAELCIELLQQDAEHYQEAFHQYNDLLIEHEEIFWSLFAVDMEHVIDQQPIESWDSFPLFQLLNDYLRVHGKIVLLLFKLNIK